MIDWNTNMEEAPKDGTPLLLYCKERGVAICNYYYNVIAGFVWDADGGGDYWDIGDPTAWARVNLPDGSLMEATELDKKFAQK